MGTLSLSAALAATALTLTSCTSPEVATAYAGTTDRRPVVVELFSSEGCSSCPPADAVLRAFDAKQPVDGAEVIALEMHVDYWNYLGWSDPFSSADFSARQRGYSTLSGRSGVYTPQMVIDGEKELVGSQGDSAKSMVAEAAKLPKAKVVLTRQGEKLQIAVSDVPEPSADSDVYLAVTESKLETAVTRGENGGSTLAHGPVVRALKKLGPSKGASFSMETDVVIAPACKRENVRAVVFLQRRKGLRIVGAALVSMK